MLLYRIEPRSSWINALSLGVFLGELEQEGFIHLSTLELCWTGLEFVLPLELGYDEPR